MSFRLLCGAVGLLICLGLCGCFRPAQGQLDEQKNPYFLTGKERVAARDYKGAIDAFEKALEVNPRSALAHYELGVLYEQRENDYAAAIYHYNRAIKLRPNAYPADNARLRLPGCKQELVKADALAIVNPTVLRDFERLREENQQLRKQLEAWQMFYANRSPTPASQVTTQNQAAIQSPRQNSGANANSNRPDGRRPGPGITPLPPRTHSTGVSSPMKTHVVKDRENPISIARQHGIKLEALMAANPALNPRKLRVGQTLKIPAS